MTLIKSVSGIRGTIGGKPGDNLSPIDLVKFTTAFSELLKQKTGKENIKIVLGRDSRISGPMVAQIVKGTLMACGVDVTDIEQATTPTTEIAVVELQADGGIILTASHNPKQWNALKLLNADGEFLSAEEGKLLLKMSSEAEKNAVYVQVDDLGKYEIRDDMLQRHIDMILDSDLVDRDLIASKNFKIVADGINSVGGPAVTALLKSLGVDNIVMINGEPNGIFAHNPEPLVKNLGEIMQRVPHEKADLGIVVDPDVDRLAFICNDGSMFGEEYTLVAVADYILQHKKGNTVSNMSSSRALRDITEKRGYEYFSSAVGELNVVEEMKKRNAVIGGEGNGGVIFPEMHYGRDALAGIALVLTYLAKRSVSLRQLRDEYPNYEMLKTKIAMSPDDPLDEILKAVELHYSNEPEARINLTDGVKIDFPDSWVHLRRSNTEPVIRIYAEAKNAKQAQILVDSVSSLIQNLS